eukprot:1196111-Prorocentrum_minimum.AAC.6
MTIPCLDRRHRAVTGFGLHRPLVHGPGVVLPHECGLVLRQKANAHARTVHPAVVRPVRQHREGAANRNQANSVKGGGIYPNQGPMVCRRGNIPGSRSGRRSRPAGARSASPR